jgi:DNA polymerase-3 subunit alpha
MKGVVEFHREAKARGIIPIIGVEFDLENREEEASRITLLAKNKKGYKSLVSLVSVSNKNIDSEGVPRIKHSHLKEYKEGIICLMGDIFSEMSQALFDNVGMAYMANSYKVCEGLVNKEWIKRCSKVIEYYSSIFEDFFVFYDLGGLPIHKVFQKAMEYLSDGEALPSNNVHCLYNSDSHIHKMLLQSKVENIKKITDQLESFFDYRIFFNDNPNVSLNSNIDKGELTLKLLDLIEDYDIKEKPILPKYRHKEKDIDDPDSLLWEECRKGFSETGLHSELKNNPSLQQIYVDRIKYELNVFKNADISSYFLIVKDIIDSVRSKGVPIDIRGSSSACLVSHLAQMSSIDPLRPDPTMPYHKSRELSFERFYNEGRNTDDNVSLADIDIDLPPTYRDKVIEYLIEMYGEECVGHIITHSRFKGKGAIKEVFKLAKPSSNYFEIANNITKAFVDEAKISDELVEIQKDEPGYGIIRWNVDHIEKVEEYYEEYKELFDTAMQIEKVPKNEGVHAAGIIVANQPLNNIFPMRYSTKMGKMVIDIEGSDIEYLGGVKFDILGVAALEKVYKAEQMINNRLSEVEFGIL